MAKKKKPRKRQNNQKALSKLEIVYMVVGILAGIVNIVYTLFQMFKVS